MLDFSGQLGTRMDMDWMTTAENTVQDTLKDSTVKEKYIFKHFSSCYLIYIQCRVYLLQISDFFIYRYEQKRLYF